MYSNLCENIVFPACRSLAVKANVAQVLRQQRIYHRRHAGDIPRSLRLVAPEVLDEYRQGVTDVVVGQAYIGHVIMRHEHAVLIHIARARLVGDDRS